MVKPIKQEPRLSQPEQSIDTLQEMFRYIHDDVSRDPLLVNVAAALDHVLSELKFVRSRYPLRSNNEETV
jgi:hypothetical protein